MLPQKDYFNSTNLLKIISGILPALIYIIYLPAHSVAAASSIDADHNSFVKISILSKRLRQIRDKNLKELVMIFPKGAIAHDVRESRHREIKKLVFSLTDNRLLLTADNTTLENQLRLVIKGKGTDDSFHVLFANEERIYPLPLEISGDENNLRLIVQENSSRYARDAAYAEYGKLSSNRQEAKAALTMLILSRVMMIKGCQPHDSFDFCDLTHCQTYAGRKSASFRLADEFPWLINTGRLSEMLYFHADCGGQTLGNNVFGPTVVKQTGIRDWLLSNGARLCGGEDDDWQAAIKADDLPQLIFTKDNMPAAGPVSIQYDQKIPGIDLWIGDYHYLLAPEDFRLRINKIRGWTFLKSNNYRVTEKTENGIKYFVFRGKGSGHGAGLCQAGALQLATLGYSRYEILEHYFPGLEFTQSQKIEQSTPPGYYRVTFSLITGKVEQYSHKEILTRDIPPGSIFKIIVSLYLAVQKPELLEKYVFNCLHNSDPNIPVKCWNPEGHGKIKFPSALANSCNLYFASLYSVIDRKNFKLFFNKLCRQLRIKSKLPAIKDNTEFAHLLAGLDYRVRFSVNDLITLTRLLTLTETNDGNIESFKRQMTLQSRTIILNALRQTMVNGTATYDHNMASSPENGHITPSKPPVYPCKDIWGKTATVIAGTNKNAVYGIFLGGCEDKGIIAFLRNGNGQKTAKIAAAQLF
ncbi:MAG: penicillin-binding transpeptidase domain-containing protein [Smithella sp.]